VNAYYATAQLEERHFGPEGSLFGGIVEYTYYRTRGEGQFSHNEYQIVTRGYFSNDSLGVNESYVVDDLVFTYCSSCPQVDLRSRGWRVTKRSANNLPATPRNVLAYDYANNRITPPPNELSSSMILLPQSSPLAELIAQSVVIDNEEISGIPTTHYRLLDSQVLSEAVRRRIGSEPNLPVELAMAQMDIWLTLGDQQVMQHTFQVEGKAGWGAAVEGQELYRFTILDQSSVTVINSSIPITVPSEVLTAVETQLKALENN
jgi:hypothetical protein